jgi:UDP-N-acetylmuramyl pentapeptide synthase
LAVINRDDAKSFDFLDKFIKVNKLNYGLVKDANVRAVDIEYSSTGIKFTAVSKDFRVGT